MTVSPTSRTVDALGCLRAAIAEACRLRHLERVWTDPVVRRHLGGPLRPDVLRKRQAAPIPNGSIAVMAEHGAVVGFCHLTEYRRTLDLELSYEFLPEHWGKDSPPRRARPSWTGPSRT